MEEALTSLLSGVAGGRRYWSRVPQSNSARPYVLLKRISGNRDYHLKGASRYVRSRVQAAAYGETYASAKATIREIIDTVSGFSGTINGVQIQRIEVDSERDLTADDTGAVTNLYLISIDLFIHHDE